MLLLRRTLEFSHPIRLREAHWRGPSSSGSQGSVENFGTYDLRNFDEQNPSLGHIDGLLGAEIFRIGMVFNTSHQISLSDPIHYPYLKTRTFAFSVSDCLHIFDYDFHLRFGETDLFSFSLSGWDRFCSTRRPKEGCRSAPRDSRNTLDVGSCWQYLGAYYEQTWTCLSMSRESWPWLAGKCPISPRPRAEAIPKHKSKIQKNQWTAFYVLVLNCGNAPLNFNQIWCSQTRTF